ncbi:hypothetical protein DPMN_106773 [Dreissena polymorpha]|uniref:Uncharacterized protein n=1 Tax=Dreissena polymorpha TaxID=45954 RepID=A0A9D4K5M0_DREPO|nr:hypothetical protein DPMN_106773 [Dreissena polymorpha]
MRICRIQLLVTVLFLASLIILTVEDFLPFPGSVVEWQMREILADIYLMTSAINPFLYMWLIKNLIDRLRCMSLCRRKLGGNLTGKCSSGRIFTNQF